MSENRGGIFLTHTVEADQSEHYGFGSNGSRSTRSAEPEKLTLEPNMK